MSSGGDQWRWGLEAPDYRPTIAVIEPPTADKAALSPRGRVERVPFGFARALVPTGICGVPRKGRPHLGGCELDVGHDGAHRYRPGDPAPIRPGATPA